MTNQYLKPLLAGLAIGTALYFLPFFFLGKVFFILLVMIFLFRIFRHRRHYRGPYSWQYADKIRSMSEDEYNAFKENYQRRCEEERTTNAKPNE